MRIPEELEYASIENKTDYKNLIEYIKNGTMDVDIDEDGFIYVDNYKIEVKKGFESIYGEIERIFNPQTEIEWDHKPTSILKVQGYEFNLY